MSLTANQIKFYAAGAHAAQGQKYGDSPYFWHLNSVVEVLQEFGFIDDEYAIIGYLHDVIEDTGVTADDLLALGLDWPLVRSVMFLTDEGGFNRKTRKTNTYNRVKRDLSTGGRATIIGVVVKWADRVANLRNCVSTENVGLLKMYRKEAQAFRYVYQIPADCDEVAAWTPMVAEHDRLVSC